MSMLSMQSRTKSGFPERISSSEDASYNNTLAVTWLSGKIEEKCFLRHWAFEVPTSSLVATAWRFRDESDTFTHKQNIALESHITILNYILQINQDAKPPHIILLDHVIKNHVKNTVHSKMLSFMWISNEHNATLYRWRSFIAYLMIWFFLWFPV